MDCVVILHEHGFGTDVYVCENEEVARETALMRIVVPNRELFAHISPEMISLESEALMDRWCDYTGCEEHIKFSRTKIIEEGEE